MQMKSSSGSIKPLLSESILLNKARYFALLNALSLMLLLLSIGTDAIGAWALVLRRKEGDLELLMVDLYLLIAIIVYYQVR